LRQGDIFRDWLIEVAGERISNKKCDVAVYEIPSSHTVCRYEFAGERYSVIGKFFSEPTGHKRYYDYYLAMRHEWRILKRLQSIIDTPKPLATMKDFNCVLLTEYVNGSPVSVIFDTEKELTNKLETIGKVIRRIHSITQRYYDKEEDFHRFFKTLEDCKLEASLQKKFERLLELWWKSDVLNQDYGCTIHDDASPRNYIFHNQKCYAIDFESSRNHANAVHDLGIMSAELSKDFIENKNDAMLAEPYIHSLLKGYSANDDEFGKVRATLGFFTSLGLLRIARFQDRTPYRSKLLQQALTSLRL
jgi:tRNA A-37 threonylcarbamoyl transferase component Bud32